MIDSQLKSCTEEISCMDIIFRRSALLVPGSMADSTEEIPCMDIILRRSALLVPGSMADSTEEIPCMDIILRPMKKFSCEDIVLPKVPDIFPEKLDFAVYLTYVQLDLSKFCQGVVSVLKQDWGVVEGDPKSLHSPGTSSPVTSSSESKVPGGEYLDEVHAFLLRKLCRWAQAITTYSAVTGCNSIGLRSTRKTTNKIPNEFSTTRLPLEWRPLKILSLVPRVNVPANLFIIFSFNGKASSAKNMRLWRYATPESRDWLIAPQNWPECSQRQHNRINNRIQAHSATDLVECSQRQHNRINNRIHAHSATAHSATGHSATHLAGVLTAPQLIAPHICCGAVSCGAMRPHPT
ncbi:hypothetical protein J6590_092112 [Homalodisca vitripennis]|nr:hypothetical protein J6590_092112 [Homalodisca vitripennis]